MSTPAQDLDTLLDTFVIADNALGIAYSYENEVGSKRARDAIHAYVHRQRQAAVRQFAAFLESRHPQAILFDVMAQQFLATQEETPQDG